MDAHMGDRTGAVVGSPLTRDGGPHTGRGCRAWGGCPPRRPFASCVSRSSRASRSWTIRT